MFFSRPVKSDSSECARDKDKSPICKERTNEKKERKKERKEGGMEGRKHGWMDG